MLIGLLSDSHGRHRAVRTAVALFEKQGVGHIIHCGDVGGIHVFDELVGHHCTFVWGNCDFPDAGLTAYLKTVGIPIPGQIPTLLELEDKRFAVFHGHERGFDGAVDTLKVNYILHGHTHIARDERINDKRIINPGALHRARQKTIATLDTAVDQLNFYEINEA